jgi:hypothetical protein
MKLPSGALALLSHEPQSGGDATDQGDERLGDRNPDGPTRLNSEGVGRTG